MKKKSKSAITDQKISGDYAALLAEVKQLVRSAQYEALKAVNRQLVGLYWDIGKMIVERQKNADHGSAIAEKLATDLREEFPGVTGFSRRNVFYMREFYRLYRNDEKVQPMVAQIGWTHNLTIMQRCKEPLEREFYIRMTRKFGWSKNVLIHQIENQTFEKSLVNQTNFDKALSPELRDQAKLAVQDEYTFDFLELGEKHSERELERALIARIENFILCKEKNRTVVEYALRDARKPIGVATYRIFKHLPENLKGELPSPAEMSRLLETI